MIYPRTPLLQGLALLAGLGIAGTVAAGPETDPVEGPLHGDWATEAELCSESRLSFTADGRHEALWFEEGEWKVQSTGTYRRDGSRLVIHIGNARQERQIISVDDQFMVLRELDESRAEALGADALTLYRCPAR